MIYKRDAYPGDPAQVQQARVLVGDMLGATGWLALAPAPPEDPGNRARPVGDLEGMVADPVRDILTVPEAARLAQVSEQAVRQWVTRDMVVAARDPGVPGVRRPRWVLTRESVLECELATRHAGRRPRSLPTPGGRAAGEGTRPDPRP